jgi:hypothetical protein
MKRHTFTVLSLFAATLILAGCNPTPKSRYYLRTEQLPEGIVTSVMDSKHNSQLLYIAELNQKPPTITVLPVSRSDVKSVSVDSLGDEEVMVSFIEQDEGNIHSFGVSTPGHPMNSLLGHVDTDMDGDTDKRVLRFETDSGFIQYFDIDANGILDAQYSMALDNESAREARILIEQCWVAILGDGATFHDPVPTVTSNDEPPTTYQFQEGSWRKTEIAATP